MALEFFNPQGINTFVNELTSDGQLIHAVNCYAPGQGILAKRPGYTSFNASLGAQINSIFTFGFQNNTTLYAYAYAGSVLQYSVQGTGAWTPAAGGTLTNNAQIGAAVFNNVIAIGDGINPLLTSANGTSFTSPGSAPVAQYFSTFHNRMYTTDGTSSNIQYSVTNDATNWQNSGTSDSSSLTAVSAGGCQQLFVAGDRLIITKSRGNMFSWDDTSLVDMSTKFGPSMPWAVKDIDNQWFYPNAKGEFSFDGANRTLISNPVQRQFYNQRGSGVGTAILGTAGCGATYNWNYLATLGTVTDDFTGRQINNAILLYDYQKNNFYNWQFADGLPTAMHGFVDQNNQQQLWFGNASGQVYQLSQTATSDAGKPIPSEAVFLFTYASQSSAFSQTSAQTVFGSSYEKKWNWIRLFFNPGDEVNIQYAFSNTLQYQHLRWSEAINSKQRGTDVGDYFKVSDGVVEMRFPDNVNNPRRGRFLFMRFYDNSDNSAWNYLGAQIDAEVQTIK